MLGPYIHISEHATMQYQTFEYFKKTFPAHTPERDRKIDEARALIDAMLTRKNNELIASIVGDVVAE